MLKLLKLNSCKLINKKIVTFLLHWSIPSDFIYFVMYLAYKFGPISVYHLLVVDLRGQQDFVTSMD